jgi:hypothetical protein
MLAYHKYTSHPYCLYLTAEELSALTGELAAMAPSGSEAVPMLAQLRDKLSKIKDMPKGGRA